MNDQNKGLNSFQFKDNSLDDPDSDLDEDLLKQDPDMQTHTYNKLLNIIIFILFICIIGLVSYHHFKLQQYSKSQEIQQKTPLFSPRSEQKPNHQRNVDVTTRQQKGQRKGSENSIKIDEIKNGFTSQRRNEDKSQQREGTKGNREVKQQRQVKSEVKETKETKEIKEKKNSNEEVKGEDPKKNNEGQQKHQETVVDKDAIPEHLKNGDFVKQKVYQEADPEMKQIFNEMISRPENRRKVKPNSIFMPTQKAYFAYKLFQQPENERFLKGQYYYYDKKYNIGSINDELPLCIVAPGRNLVKESKFKRFLSSVARQNYTNYKIIYIDDVSDDDSPAVLSDYVSNNFPFLKQRLTIVKNTERVYALANRNNGIRNYCNQSDIVLDVDADDAFIGKQAFKFVNSVYHDSGLWQSNSVFIYVDKVKKQVTTGPQDGVPQKLLEQNAYRGSLVWKTSELRTFRARLFNKIDQNDFKDENGNFYKWASDVFMQEPLVELASAGHYKHYYEILYFYDWNLDRTTVYKRRHYRDIAWCQTPYNPLKSLDEAASKVENYVVPEKARTEYEKNIREGRKQAIKYHRQAPF